MKRRKKLRRPVIAGYLSIDAVSKILGLPRHSAKIMMDRNGIDYTQSPGALRLYSARSITDFLARRSLVPATVAPEDRDAALPAAHGQSSRKEILPMTTILYRFSLPPDPPTRARRPPEPRVDVLNGTTVFQTHL